MSGGVERIISWLASSLATKDFQVTLLTWDKNTGTPFYDLHPNIKLVYLEVGDPYRPANLGERIQRFIKIRQIIGKITPDIVVGFQIGTLVPLWVGTIFRKTKLICTERNSLQYLQLTEGRFKRWILPFYYALADLLVVQFDEYKKFYPFCVKTHVIHNPVFNRPVFETEKKNVLLSVGRLSYQKNYELLIDAFKIIHSKLPDWQLIILGGGADHQKLSNLIGSPDVDYIKVVPPSKDVDVYYSSSKLFCLPSRWEGFPNALAEALASGLPSIGYISCDGVNILIKDQENGFLVAERTAEALAEKILILAKDTTLQVSMSANAKKIVEFYDPEKILISWIKTFEELIK